MTKRKRIPPKKVADRTDAPSVPKDTPVYCPLFPTVKCASVGKVHLLAVEYEDDDTTKHYQTVIHPRVTPEMDEADIAAIAGGGEYEVMIHKNDGTNELISRRKVEIFGPPKDFDDDEEDGGDPKIIRNADGSQTVIPPGLKGPALASYLAQEERIKDAKRSNEGGGPMGAVLTGMFSMMGSMMQGGGQQNAAVQALQSALNAANEEKIRMLSQHGEAMSRARDEHAKDTAALRTDLSKERDEVRRLTLLMETKIAEALRLAQERHVAEAAKLRSEVTRLESALLGRDRELVRMQGAANSASETVELARILSPHLNNLVGGLAGKALPADLQGTVDAIQKEILPAVRRLNAHPLLAMGASEPPAVTPASDATIVTPDPAAAPRLQEPEPTIAVPTMPD